MVNEHKITTIKVGIETKSRLDKLRVHHKESYDEVIQKILYILNLCKSGSSEARARLLAIDKAKKLNLISPKYAKKL
ncbi:MAG: hypothetical protein AABX94_04815 [Nanoarchaeota archaeon]